MKLMSYIRIFLFLGSGILPYNHATKCKLSDTMVKCKLCDTKVTICFHMFPPSSYWYQPK